MRIPIPREHGAWAMLLTSLALGQIVAWSVNVWSICLWLLAIAIFVAKEPLVLLWRPRRTSGWSRQYLLVVTAGLLGLSALLIGVLVAARGVGILWLGFPAVVLFAIQLWWQRSKARWSWQAELLGTAGITIAAPAAYWAATGSLGHRVWLSLWLVTFTYFATQVAYVRWRVRASGDKSFGLFALAAQVFALLLFLGLGAAGWVPPLLFIAFIPGVAKTIFSLVTVQGTKRRTTKLGWIEVIFSLMFVLLAAVAYRLA